jgi:hypothetical protein
MATNLDTLSLVQLTAQYNALPGVTPVKKFPSKAVALDRIAKATPATTKPVRQHLVLEAVEGQSLASRRRPLGDTAARVQELVAKFGGQTVTMKDAAAALGVEVAEIKRRVKRLQSWYGKDMVERKAGSFTIGFTAK